VKVIDVAGALGDVAGDEGEGLAPDVEPTMRHDSDNETITAADGRRIRMTAGRGLSCRQV
jgi:hypothetical protein